MNRFHYASTKDDNLRYLLEIPYEISDPFFYLEVNGKKHVFLHSLEIDAFNAVAPTTITGLNDAHFRAAARELGKPQLANMAGIILKEYSVPSVQVPTNFPLDVADHLRNKGIELEVVSNWIPERIIKSQAEIDFIKANQQVTVGAFNHIERELAKASVGSDGTLERAGVPLTSERVKQSLAHYFLDHDLISPEGMVVACGEQASMPHHEGEGVLRANKTIVVDLFPRSKSNRYFADMTRTYVKGQPTKKVEAMYKAVSDAKKASLLHLKPGVMASEVYKTSARVIKEAGFEVGEAGYIHSLGHGLGVSVHELPNLGPYSKTVLEPGMVVTIEPGLYYKEHGGVRIEDAVVITETGYENLTNHPENWLIT